MKYAKRILLFIVVFMAFFASITVVTADSGWDSDYGSSDSGGWDSGDWDSGGWDSGGGGSWDIDSGSSRSSSTGRKPTGEPINPMIPITVFTIIGVILTVFLIEKILIEKKKITEENDRNEKFLSDQDDLIKKYFSDLDEKKLLDILVNKFIDIQMAWMNFDYDSLEKLCTKELYQSYKSDLEILKSKNEKNIMNNFDLVVSNIKEVKEEKGVITILMYMRMDFTDYVINVSTNEVVRGKSNGKVINQYDIEFVVSKDIIDKCPNCGALLNNENTCSHCGTYVDIGYSDFVMSSKKKIS